MSTVAYSQTLNIDRARELLGYEPAVSIDESLAGYAEEASADAAPADEGSADG